MAGGDVGAIGVHTWSALVHERLVNFQSIKLKQQVGRAMVGTVLE